MNKKLEKIETIPAMPNWFPYNELLLSGKLSAKTRDWRWKHTGLVLLYTSTRVEPEVAQAYGLNLKDFQQGVLVGVGELLPVRENTEEEAIQIEREFANSDSNLIVQAGYYRYEFNNLKRFRKPIPFKPPRGAVTVFRVPVSLVKEALEEIGVEIINNKITKETKSYKKKPMGRVVTPKKLTKISEKNTDIMYGCKIGDVIICKCDKHPNCFASKMELMVKRFDFLYKEMWMTDKENGNMEVYCSNHPNARIKIVRRVKKTNKK